MNDIRCGQCRRKLAEGRYIEITIKCPRCGTHNHLKAAEPPTRVPRAPEGNPLCNNSITSTA